MEGFVGGEVVEGGLEGVRVEDSGACGVAVEEVVAGEGEVFGFGEPVVEGGREAKFVAALEDVGREEGLGGAAEEMFGEAVADFFVVGEGEAEFDDAVIEEWGPYFEGVGHGDGVEGFHHFGESAPCEFAPEGVVEEAAEGFLAAVAGPGGVMVVRVGRAIGAGEAGRGDHGEGAA